jgi:hypothetical protein
MSFGTDSVYCIISKNKYLKFKAMKTLIKITRRLNLSGLFVLAVLFLSINALKGQEDDYSQLIKSDNDKTSSLHQSVLLTDCSLSVYDAKEEEAVDEIEQWMMDTGFWSDIDTNEDEPEMDIESWMYDTELWAEYIVENEMEIEVWMSDTNFWKI